MSFLHPPRRFVLAWETALGCELIDGLGELFGQLGKQLVAGNSRLSGQGVQGVFSHCLF
jgi:hypothetical protein